VNDPGARKPKVTRTRKRPVSDYTEEEAADLKRRYESGESSTQLMQGFEGSYRTLRTILENAGVIFRTTPPTPALPPGMAEMYLSGRSLRYTAAKFNVSLSMAKRMFDNAGIPLRSRGRPPSSSSD
jgi:hypothetical protein